jgi:hypothetical protein
MTLIERIDFLLQERYSEDAISSLLKKKPALKKRYDMIISKEKKAGKSDEEAETIAKQLLGFLY